MPLELAVGVDKDNGISFKDKRTKRSKNFANKKNKLNTVKSKITKSKRKFKKK